MYPVARACEIGVQPEINDELRLDGHLDGTSVSIGFPNNQMFWKCRKDNEDVAWVVLGLDPSILWKKECAFCRHNAADNAISCIALDELKTFEAFEGMYEEIDGLESRAEQKLKAYDPTDVQAEILVFDVIEPEYILGGAFETVAVKNTYTPLLGNRKVIVKGPCKGYFASRSYVRKYR